MGPASASAAEVLASALQLNHRAKLIGRATGGSLMFSQGFPLPDGGSVRVPVAAFLDAHGKPVEGVGVVPDIETIPTLAAIRSGHDSALERAAAELALGAHRRAAQLP
jgi:C-terminal processing protease CtpA/Prc